MHLAVLIVAAALTESNTNKRIASIQIYDQPQQCLCVYNPYNDDARIQLQVRCIYLRFVLLPTLNRELKLYLLVCLRQ